MNPNLRPADRCLLSQDDFSRDSGLALDYFDGTNRRGEWLVVGAAVATIIALVLWFGGYWS